jgi:hypothetical protein
VGLNRCRGNEKWNHDCEVLPGGMPIWNLMVVLSLKKRGQAGEPNPLNYLVELNGIEPSAS